MLERIYAYFLTFAQKINVSVAQTRLFVFCEYAN